MPLEGLANFGKVMFANPSPQQVEEKLAMDPAITLAAKVGAHTCLQLGKGAAEAGGFAEAGPLPGGKSKNHHVAPVASAEVCPESAVNLVPEAAARLRLGYRLANQSQMARHRKGDVG